MSIYTELPLHPHADCKTEWLARAVIEHEVWESWYCYDHDLKYKVHINHTAPLEERSQMKDSFTKVLEVTLVRLRAGNDPITKTPHIIFDEAKKLISSAHEKAVREAHMRGWHEGRATATNPDYTYNFTDNKETGDE